MKHTIAKQCKSHENTGAAPSRITPALPVGCFKAHMDGRILKPALRPWSWQVPRSAGRAGFSMVELMIVAAIIAILAALAYPAYQKYVIKTNRRAAQACLAEHANYMERLYTTTLNYSEMPIAGSTTTTPLTTLPALACDAPSQTGKNYTYSFSTSPTPTTYTVRAVPFSQLQLKDTCGTLTINQAGTRTPTTSGCW